MSDHEQQDTPHSPDSPDLPEIDLSDISDDALDDTRIGNGAAEEDPAAVLQRDLEELDEKYKRALADYQNFARRARQEVHTAKQQQLRDVAKSLLTVLDHFDHALQADADKTSVEDLLQGVKIVHAELMKTLENFGICRIAIEEGEAFDPNKHEAMMRQSVDGLEPNHVARELQSGYLLGDITLRPAKVAVTE